MKYLHFFEANIAHLMLKVGYGVISDNEILEVGNHNIFMITEEEARECSKRNGYKFNDLRVKPPKADKPQLPKDPVSKKRPSEKCLDDARRLLGKGKYASFGNYCYGDGYFARSCINKYGESLWDLACSIVKNE